MHRTIYSREPNIQAESSYPWVAPVPVIQVQTRGAEQFHVPLLECAHPWLGAPTTCMASLRVLQVWSSEPHTSGKVRYCREMEWEHLQYSVQVLGASILPDSIYPPPPSLSLLITAFKIAPRPLPTWHLLASVPRWSALS